mmetsp:Transcript_35032/g.109483  ORF Transcript_35032/g.109483 Transcript_35032/m.109483 type:complete len:143 (-) Transcript_35032:476-904(-)
MQRQNAAAAFMDDGDAQETEKNDKSGKTMGWLATAAAGLGIIAGAAILLTQKESCPTEEMVVRKIRTVTDEFRRRNKNYPKDEGDFSYFIWRYKKLKQEDKERCVNWRNKIAHQNWSELKDEEKREFYDILCRIETDLSPWQ